MLPVTLLSFVVRQAFKRSKIQAFRRRSNTWFLVGAGVLFSGLARVSSLIQSPPAAPLSVVLKVLLAGGTAASSCTQHEPTLTCRPEKHIHDYMFAPSESPDNNCMSGNQTL